MHGTTNVAFFYRGGILLGSDSRRGSGLSIRHDDYTHKIVHLTDRLFVTKCGESKGAVEKVITESRRLAASAAHTPESLANEVFSFMKHNKIERVASLIVGYNGTVPQIYKVRYREPGVIGVRKIENYFAIGSGATWALNILDRVYVPDMTHEASKGLVQDALIHASFNDHQSGGGIDQYFITLHGYSCESDRVLKYYLERYNFLHKDDTTCALLVAIPLSAHWSGLLIGICEQLFKGYEVIAKHSIAHLEWFNMQYYVYRVALEGIGGANEVLTQLQLEGIDGPYQIGDDIAGAWARIVEDESELLRAFVCEDTQIMIHYLLAYNPSNPGGYLHQLQ